MWLLRRYLTHEPAGFDVFCFTGNILVSRSVPGLLTALVLAQFGAPLVQCATREVHFVVWDCWLDLEQGGCSLIPLDALSATPPWSLSISEMSSPKESITYWE